MNGNYSINRPEWRQLLNGELNVNLKNFFFQMKVTQLREMIKDNRIPMEVAVEELYTLTQKFSKAKYMDEDLKAIFEPAQSSSSSASHPTETKNSHHPMGFVIPGQKKETPQITPVDPAASHSQTDKSINKEKPEHEDINAKIAKIREETERQLRMLEQKRLELEQKLAREGLAPQQSTDKPVSGISSKKGPSATSGATLKNTASQRSPKKTVNRQALAEKERQALLRKKRLAEQKKKKKSFWKRFFGW